MTAACMGGWCHKRNQCGRHIQPDRRVVVERLCERGQETPQGSTDGVWLRRDGWVDLLKRAPMKRETE